MSLFDKGCGCTDPVEQEGNCDSCVYYQLRRLTPGTTVDVIINGVEFAALIFACIDNNTCCATFLDGTSPFIVGGSDIQALRLLPTAGA